MSTDCSSPRVDHNQFLKNVTWLNEDFPEANLALLDGIRNGLTGYKTDKIIRSAATVLRETCNQSPSSPDNELNLANGKAENEDDDHFATMEQLLLETTPLSPLPRNASTSPIGPLKRNSVLTVRPRSIGEERKAWILEAQRAYCLNDLQNNRFLNSVSECFYRSTSAPEMDRESLSNYMNEPASMSCPDLEGRGETTQECELEHCTSDEPSPTIIHDQDSSTESIEDKDSCEFLFHHVEGCFKPSKIRLSPRIEKLDKLIPKTSKEFLNTMRIVSTISPQPSEEQLHSLQGIHSDEDTKSGSNDVNHNTSTDDSDELEENHIETDHHPSCPDADASRTRLAGQTCRSYKEVCIYGPHSTSGTHSSSIPSDQLSEKVYNDNSRAKNFQSTSGFPSLPMMVKSGTGVGGEDAKKAAPPLYSSILQRSPTNTYGCGEMNCGEPHTLHHQSSKTKGKTSPIAIPTSPLALGSFDCGFCRTNNEPECVYRSHPLRVNDIVVCPSLRKYVCCFCGATGDKAHTIKYCPKNPIGFFAKKTRNSPVPQIMTVLEKPVGKPASVETTTQVQLSPVKSKDSKNVSPNKEQIIQTDEESKVNVESVKVIDSPTFEPIKRTSGNWIEAKTKGRKRKGGK